MIINSLELYRSVFSPFVAAKAISEVAIMFDGKEIRPSYGPSESSYDIRIGEKVTLVAGYMIRVPSLERFAMPRDHVAFVSFKSTCHRMGITSGGWAEPGWCGILTIECTYVPVLGGPSSLSLPAGWPIAATRFFRLLHENDYAGQRYHHAGAADGPA